jgi:dTDP-4-amino-4,6-dideoxygalactose transaminase
MTGPALAIEEFFQRRYRREALYVPSGRLALYLAFREWLRPGDRLLMSPVNDDVVFFTVLAAGLIPVLGPIDPATGNLDPAALSDRTWSSLKAVMTTNLYGIPDRMDRLQEQCGRHGLTLIEDACQALDSRFGDRGIGQISTVSAFSLTKHVDGVGGVLCFSEGERRAALARRAAGLIERPGPAQRARQGIRLLLRNRTDRAGARRVLHTILRRLHSGTSEREGHRMPYDTGRVLEARQDGAGLDRFHRWVRVDNAGYRTEPLAAEIRTTLQQLEHFDDNRRRRLEGARAILGLGLTPPSLRLPHDTALFRVPLFVRDRERTLALFAARGLHLDYIYDPPLDLYAAPPLAERIPSPEGAQAWSRDVLPVDPLRADRFLSILKNYPGLCMPATPTA